MAVIKARRSGRSRGGKKAGGEIGGISWLIGCEGQIGYYMKSEFRTGSLAIVFIPHQSLMAGVPPLGSDTTLFKHLLKYSSQRISLFKCYFLG